MSSKGGRPSGPKTRNGGKWTESKWRSFIKNQLRSATRKWPPIQECKKEARVARGIYRCDICKQDVPASIKDGRKRVNNIVVDHRSPVINVETGWTTWDAVVEGLFCEKDNLSLVCVACHKQKSLEENQQRKYYRDLKKEEHIED